MAQQDNATLVRGMYEAFNRKDFNAIQNLGAPTTEWLEVPFREAMKGPSALKEVWQGWAGVFPDGNIEVRSVTAMGDLVVVEGIGRGTHKGVFRSPIGDLQPTGKKVEIPFCDILRLQNGKIVSGRSYFDFYMFIRQLGLEEKVMKAA